MQESTASSPKLKNGIHFFQIEGGVYHVFDPATARHFRMGGQEVGWLQLLDGQRSKAALRDQIPLEYFDSFFANAARLDLLEGPRPSPKRDLFKIKLPLGNPNNRLNSLGRLALLYRVLLNRLSIVFLLFNISALVQIGRHNADFYGAIHFTPWLALFYIVSILTAGVCHELSHAVVAKSFGVNVPAIGAMLFYLHPSFYADVSGIRLLQARGPRINVLLAGVMANNFLLSLTLFLYFLARGPFSTYLLYFAWMNVILVLVNLIPFIEYDGHYILQELLNEPNLAIRAKQSVRTAGPRRIELLAYLALSQAFSLAAIASALLLLRRGALHIAPAPYVDSGCLILMIGAYVALVRRSRSNRAKA